MHPVTQPPVRDPFVGIDGVCIEAARTLRHATQVTLLAHLNPDADALGSALALGLALQRRGAQAQVSFSAPDDPPESLRELDVAGLLVPASEVESQPEVLVVLDTASAGRLGALGGRLDTAGCVLVIDHHTTNTRFGDLHLVDDRAEATAVLALRLLDELGAVVDEPVARCLYAGLVTDTSSFRRAGVATHRMATRLIAAGVDPTATTRALLDTHPFGYLSMLGTVLGKAVLEPEAVRGHGLVHATVWWDVATGMRSEEVESVIDLVRTTAEAEVAAVFKQVGPQEWSVSLRSKERIDVGAVATVLGGGGHRLASGYTASGSIDEVRARLHAELAAAGC